MKAFGLIQDKDNNEYKVIVINYEIKNKKVVVDSFELHSAGSVEAVALVEANKRLVRHTMGLD